MQRLLRKLGPSATDMIRADHTRVMATFHRYTADVRPGKKQALARTIAMALQVHARIEEEIFYPAMRSAGSTLLEDLEPEHQEMRSLIAQLTGLDPASTQFDQTFHELMRTVMHHVADEETMLLPHAESVLGERLGELGAQMMRRRLELMAPQAMPGGALMLGAGALLAGLLLLRKRA